MSDLEIIGIPQSTYVRTVRVALEEKGVAYTQVMAFPHSPEVDAINPFGRVPVMRHGQIRLFESKAIATYVDKAFPGPKLFPDDPYASALIEQWTAALNSVILPNLMTYVQGYFVPRTADGKPNREAIERALSAMRAHIELLDRAVSDRDCLTGDGFTYADMALMPWLFLLPNLPESAEIVGSMHGLNAYFKRHAERPSFVKTDPPPMPK